MRALEIHVNGKRLCTAAVGDDGVLTAIVRSVVRPVQSSGRKRRIEEDLGLEVGGLLAPTLEHIRWKAPRLRTGDEVCIKITDVALADKPASRMGCDPRQNVKAEKKYVEAAAKRLGWKISKTGKSRAGRRPGS